MMWRSNLVHCNPRQMEKGRKIAISFNLEIKKNMIKSRMDYNTLVESTYPLNAMKPVDMNPVRMRIVEDAGDDRKLILTSLRLTTSIIMCIMM